jgi:pimeloyl-ACP methyl ester carboxylesterase
MTLDQTFDFGSWRIAYQLRQPEEHQAQHHELRTIVFVHGTPWSSEVFGPIAATLVLQGHRVLLYDLAGYGQSQRLTLEANATSLGEQFNIDTSVKTQAHLLAELLKHLKLDASGSNVAPDIIAHDIAGAIALRAHLTHGCKFRSLLLLDTNAVLPWGDGFYKLVRSEPEVFRKLPPNIFEAMTRAVIRSACFNPKKLDAGWEDILANAWVSSGEDQTARQDSFVRQIAQANDADVAEMLDQNMYKNVQCPVKIIWGENDQWIPREKMDQLAGMLKHCLKEFVVVPEAGHLVMIDQPVRVAFEIFSWLDRQ